MRRAALRLAIATAVLLSAAAGVSYATDRIALRGGGETTIRGCHGRDGVLRAVTGRARCRPNEQSISWNRTGPRGPQGLRGALGPAGPEGEPGEPGADGDDGEDGQDGEDGEDGQDGQDGEDGEDGGLSCNDEARIKAALPTFELSPSCSTVKPPPCTDPADAPGSREAAVSLGSIAGDRFSPRLRVEGRICPADTDWFRFDLREEQANQLKDLGASVTLNGGRGANLDLCVYAADGALVACSRGAGDLEEVVVRVVDDEAKDDGTTFFVEVVGASADAANEYDLKVKRDVD